MLERIEQLHSLFLVHNDLKLENVVIGIDDPSKIYLIDFGLTAKYVDENGDHIVKQYIRNFSGNFLFASLNSSRGFNKSRRDDIESLFYILIYMMNEEYLPWCDLLTKDPTAERTDLKVLLKERLDLKYTRKLFSKIPSELTDCLKKVLTLTFDEAPNYQYFKETLA
jgi:casein kinase 1